MPVEFYSKLSDVVGMIGVILVLIAYLLLNTGKISSKNINYLLLNLVGACLILFSLLYTWNLASVVIEVAWILISIIGLIRVLWRKHSNKN